MQDNTKDNIKTHSVDKAVDKVISQEEFCKQFIKSIFECVGFQNLNEQSLHKASLMLADLIGFIRQKDDLESLKQYVEKTIAIIEKKTVDSNRNLTAEEISLTLEGYHDKETIIDYACSIYGTPSMTLNYELISIKYE